MGVERNVADSMRSTWRQLDRREWTAFHWFYEILGIQPTSLEKEIPKHKKTEPMPYLPEWHMHRWILLHAFLPIGIHHAYYTSTGQNLGPLPAYLLYTAFFKFNAIREMHALRRLGHIVGFLDGDVCERDGVPDVGVSKVIMSLITATAVRPMFIIILSYSTSVAPGDADWSLLPLEIGLYSIILDFWFYWYHRSMHDFASLWKYHRTHHLTKHPNPLLTLYADTEQEIFDIAGIPLMTYGTMRLFGLPIGFYEWWVCHQYVIFAELVGHSGLRLLVNPPSTITWLLKAFNADLVIEDHDLHHRHGWRSSANYGKQTRLWDRIFGTCRDRIETQPDKINWDTPVAMPLVSF